jgi:biotin carboxyl carrier protein
MRYYVTVDGQEVPVDVEGDRVTLGGRTYAAVLTGVPGTPLHQLVIDGRPLDLGLHREGSGRWAVTLRGERAEVEVVDERTRHVRGLTAGAGERHGAGTLKAPMPGLVVRVLAAPGQPVAAGAGVVVLEAMKMENELRAPAAATVRAVLVRPGEAVERGQALVDFE